MDTDLTKLAAHFADEGKAIEFFEGMRWPNDSVCPHCKSTKAYALKVKSAKRRVWKCASCRKQFSVMIGTIFEGSHIPLNKWLIAIYMMSSSKKGISANQLSRSLDITYKSAWFMCHRIRYAMNQSPLAEKLQGVVEVDETYVGGRVRNRYGKAKGTGTRGREAAKKTVKQRRKPPVSLDPLGFEEAVSDILKVKPPPDKPKRGGKDSGKKKPPAKRARG